MNWDKRYISIGNYCLESGDFKVHRKPGNDLYDVYMKGDHIGYSKDEIGAMKIAESKFYKTL